MSQPSVIPAPKCEFLSSEGAQEEQCLLSCSHQSFPMVIPEDLGWWGQEAISPGVLSSLWTAETKNPKLNSKLSLFCLHPLGLFSTEPAMCQPYTPAAGQAESHSPEKPGWTSSIPGPAASPGEMTQIGAMHRMKIKPAYFTLYTKIN